MNSHGLLQEKMTGGSQPGTFFDPPSTHFDHFQSKYQPVELTSPQIEIPWNPPPLPPQIEVSLHPSPPIF